MHLACLTFEWSMSDVYIHPYTLSSVIKLLTR